MYEMFPSSPADLLLYGIPDRSHGRKMQGLHPHLRSHLRHEHTNYVCYPLRQDKDFSSFLPDERGSDDLLPF